MTKKTQKPTKRVYKKRVYKKRKQTSGYMNVNRRYPEIGLRNSSLAGNVVISSTPATTILFANGVASSNQIGAWDIPFAMSFTLADLCESSDFSVLFDSYKINKITIKAYFSSQKTDWSNGGSPTTAPTIEYTTDHDDADVPTLLGFRSKMGYKTKSFKNNSFITMTVKPRVAQSVYNAGMVNAYSTPTKSIWLDMANNGVPHYGIKGIISNMPLPAQGSIGLTTAIKWEIQANVSLKGLQ